MVGGRRTTLTTSSDHTRSSRHQRGSGPYDSSYHLKFLSSPPNSSTLHKSSRSQRSSSHRDSSNKDGFDDNLSEVSLDTALLHEAANQNLHKEWPELLADLKLELAQTKAELDSQGLQFKKSQESNKSLEEQLSATQAENADLKQQLKDLQKRLWVQGTLSTNSNTNSSSSHHRRSLDTYMNNNSHRGSIGPGCILNGGAFDTKTTSTTNTEDESYQSGLVITGDNNNAIRRTSTSSKPMVQLRDLLSDSDDSDDESITWPTTASKGGLPPKGSKAHHDSVKTIEFQESSMNTLPEEDLPEVQEEGENRKHGGGGKFEDFSSRVDYVAQQKEKQIQKENHFHDSSDHSQPMTMKDLGEPLLDIALSNNGSGGGGPPGAQSSSSLSSSRHPQQDDEQQETTTCRSSSPPPKQQQQQEKYDPDDPFHTMYEEEDDDEAEPEERLHQMQNWLTKKGIPWGSGRNVISSDASTNTSTRSSGFWGGNRGGKDGHQ
eukprot:CAMPEP_0195290750 /NCGR_PEP_ID=MMETSP0707-20130614/6494_1 /TAXON_ID=33640 /ORGANISM="Asterionellopsis glacialis, Strain CCMP134" /LENGTH=489 /DNA_ID=CAMNT_0040350917 /DNA_START=59 /DNA_END=1531 /DNA_ORIENTATION=+